VLGLPLSAQSAELAGRVVGVHDGDTITLLENDLLGNKKSISFTND